MIGVQAAQLELAKQRLIDTTTLAPADGVIQSRMVSKGTYVQTGQALCVLVENKKLRFRASVPERYATNWHWDRRCGCFSNAGLESVASR